MDPVQVAQFPYEGTPVFPVETPVEATTPDSPTETKTDTTPTPAPEGGETTGEETKTGSENNFADHPRWKEREEDWKGRFNSQEERHTKSLADLREEFETKLTNAQPTKTEDTTPAPTQIPAWFGGDDDQWADFQTWNKALLKETRDAAKEEAVGEVEKKTASNVKAIKEATVYMNEQIAEIQTDKILNPDGTKIDRNKLLKIVVDNDLVDSKGRWNYKAAFGLMKSQPAIPATTDVEGKKKLAAATTDDTAVETKPSEVTTSEDFKKPGNRPW